MANQNKDQQPILARNVELQQFTTQSASMLPINASYGSGVTNISHTGPMYNRRSTEFIKTIINGDTGYFTRKLLSKLQPHFPVMIPGTKKVQRWNKFFAISCLVAIFIDPLFFFVLSAWKEQNCVFLNFPFAVTIATIRSITDFIYLLHIILQFRLAYVAPESRVVGAGDLVDEPKKIAWHYFSGYFALDLFILLPLSQVMILEIMAHYFGASSASSARNLLYATVLLQYIPRICRFIPLLAGQSATGFIFESAWANFIINLLMFVLAGHVVGSCWYLFGLQRVNRCLKDACRHSGIPHCESYRDCGTGNVVRGSDVWINNANAIECFSIDGWFDYGIYQKAVNLTARKSIVTRYIYSLVWGFQQISTLAGNLTPSYFEGEVLFTMAIVGLGLFLFALLIGNMQNFLLALGRRRLDMQLRRRDVEKWMSRRRLPEKLRRKVSEAERFKWFASQGTDEEELIKNLPEDLQRDIRRHFFQFLKNARIFALMDEPMLDAIFEKLRQTLYITGNDILYKGGPVDKMVFIVRGKIESIGEDGNVTPMSEGAVCGEELLTWYLEQLNKENGKERFGVQRLIANRTIKCLTNVEGFALRSDDLEEITSLFSSFLRQPHVQAEISKMAHSSSSGTAASSSRHIATCTTERMEALIEICLHHFREKDTSNRHTTDSISFVQSDRFRDAVARSYSILSAINNVQRWEIMEIFRTDPSVLEMMEVLSDDEVLGYLGHHVTTFRRCH